MTKKEYEAPKAKTVVRMEATLLTDSGMEPEEFDFLPDDLDTP